MPYHAVLRPVWVLTDQKQPGSAIYSCGIAMVQADPSALTSIARAMLTLLAHPSLQDKLIDPSSVTHLFKVCIRAWYLNIKQIITM